MTEFTTLPCGRIVIKEPSITSTSNSTTAINQQVPSTPCGDSSLEKGSNTPTVPGLGRRWERGFSNGLKGRIVNL